MSQHDERRRAPRVESIHLVSVDQFDAKGFHTDLAIGRTLDISRLGMRLELNHPLPLRTTVSMSLAIGDQLIPVEGRVVFARDLQDGRFSMGIEFQSLSEAAEKALAALLPAASPASPLLPGDDSET